MLYGDRVEGEIDNTGTSSWSFIGIEDDIIDIIVAPNGDLDVVIDVLNENGTSVLDTKVDDSFYEEQIADLALTTSGFFYISVTSYDGTPGSYTLVINKAGASPATSGVTGGNVVRNKVMKGSVTGSEESLWTVAATRGEFLNISVIPTTEEFDVVVDVWDKNGRSLLDRPLDESYDTEYIRTLPVPFDGLYTIVITSFDGSDGEYDLLVEESYHNQPASFIFATDSLGSAEEVHDFFFEAPKGDLVIIHVYPVELEFDVIVQVYKDTGQLLDEVDATTGFEELLFTAPADGIYYFRIAGFDGSTGEYDVTLIGSDRVSWQNMTPDYVRE